MKFTAVAFDLDGTLYPDISLFVRLIPFFLKEQRLLRAMNKARIRLRKTGAYEGDFYELQARLMGGILKEEPEKVRERSETLIYRGWEPHFKKIKLYPRVKETLDIFRKEGIKMGILSDFPPEKKLENLGINGYWDAVVCSEQCGRLKPDPLSFF
ncbi:MAG: HAD family hydrolase, partial [Treponema sp.]|nr:HAD family hydrolase [Treponema sp.]